jgi:hypothetical protein
VNYQPPLSLKLASGQSVLKTITFEAILRYYGANATKDFWLARLEISTFSVGGAA